MNNVNKKYLVVGSKRWNHQVFEEIIKHYPGEWHFAQTAEELDFAKLEKLSPRYIFFLHWSLKVPQEVIDNFECVCFHMTDVPYGRGGSPLQNLIALGHRQTKLTALKMVGDFDAGAVYLKKDLSLEGNAEEIYIRASELSAEMIAEIIKTEPEPIAQTGEVTIFKRRKPKQSEIVEAENLKSLYDFIRMLDADGYPLAFLEHKGYYYEFRRAGLYDGRIEADVKITKLEDKNQ